MRGMCRQVGGEAHEAGEAPEQGAARGAEGEEEAGVSWNGDKLR